MIIVFRYIEFTAMGYNFRVRKAAAWTSFGEKWYCERKKLKNGNFSRNLFLSRPSHDPARLLNCCVRVDIVDI